MDEELTAAVVEVFGIDAPPPGEADSRLEAALRAADEDRVFDGKLHYFVTAWGTHSYERLRSFLRRRSKLVGAKQAVTEVRDYIKADRLPYSHVLAIGGIDVERSWDFGGGIQLVPLEGYHDQVVDSLRERFAGFAPRYQPSAVLRCTRKHRKEVKDITEGDPPLMDFPDRVPDQDLEDVQVLFSVTGQFAPLRMGSWAIPDPSVPSTGWGLGLPMPFEVGGFPSSRTPDMAFFVDIHECWSRLPSRTRTHLRVALERVNQAIRRKDALGRAIDLGIAMEATFLPDMTSAQGELGFRLRLRAARFLQPDPAHRKRILDRVKDLYNLRSKAVHEGMLPKRVGGRDPRQVLNDGIPFVSGAIERIVREGEPDWEQVVLG